MIGLLLALTLSELPPQKLESGGCAMVLWERGSRRRIAFWPAAGPLMLGLEAGPAMLPPVAGSGTGNPVLGLLPGASFAGANIRLRLDVQISTSELTPRSAMVPDGLLALTDADGAEMLVPVAGVIGCG